MSISTLIYRGGLGVDEEKAFRKYFRYIGTLRSVFSEATVLALSATCTLKMKKQIIKSLNLNDPKIVELSPNRSNIKLVVRRTPTSVEESFFWVVENLNLLKDQFPRTLIYCNSIKDVCEIFNYIVSESNLHNNKLVEMFHSETPSVKKEDIVMKLGMNSDLRLVIATSALGMGIDVKNCTGVVLYGPPKDVVDLLQESGRCGRCGDDSVCIVFCNRYQMNHVSTEVKEVIRSVECRRKCLLSNFASECDISTSSHLCCDICAGNCKCGSCSPHPLESLVGTFDAQCEEDYSSDSDTISYEYESDDNEGCDAIE